MPGTCTLQHCGGSGEDGMFSHLGKGFDYCSQGSLSLLPAWSWSRTGSGPSSGVAWLQEPFQFCCEVVGSCTGRSSLSCSWVGVSGKEDKMLDGDTKRIRVSQVPSGVGLRLGCSCFGQSHQGSSSFQACRIEAVGDNSHLGSSKAAPKPCDCVG